VPRRSRRAPRNRLRNPLPRQRAPSRCCNPAAHRRRCRWPCDAPENESSLLFRGPFDVQGEWATGGVESEPPGDRPTPLSFCLRPALRALTSQAKLAYDATACGRCGPSIRPSAAIVGSSPLAGLRAPSLHSFVARTVDAHPALNGAPSRPITVRDDSEFVPRSLAALAPVLSRRAAGACRAARRAGGRRCGRRGAPGRDAARHRA